MFLLQATYSVVRLSVRRRGPIDGIRNARDVLDLEQRLNLDWERELQRISLPHELPITAANWYYVAGVLPVILSLAALSAWRVPEAFRRWRGVFAVTLLMALVGFVLFPLAPPRMLSSSEGFVDMLVAYGPRYYGDAEGESLFNGHGAFPRLVNVYSALAAEVLSPTLMAVTVVVTANHYVLNVVIGVVGVGIGGCV